MPVCPSCSRDVADGARFCGYCGARMHASVDAAAAQPSPPPDAAGYWICAACSVENKAGAGSCAACGAAKPIPLAGGPPRPAPIITPRAAKPATGRPGVTAPTRTVQDLQPSVHAPPVANTPAAPAARASRARWVALAAALVAALAVGAAVVAVMSFRGAGGDGGETSPTPTSALGGVGSASPSPVPSRSPSGPSSPAVVTTESEPGVIAFVRDGDIWVMDAVADADGSAQFALTSAADPARQGGRTLMLPIWSPDGSRIAFVAVSRRNEGPYSLWTMLADGSEQEEVPLSGSDASAGEFGELTPMKPPVWSADMTSIVWARDKPGSPQTGQTVTQLMMTAVASGSTRMIYETRAESGQPPTLLRPSQWSQDGASLRCGSFVLSIGGSQVSAGGVGTEVLAIDSAVGQATRRSARVYDSERYPWAAPVVAWSPSGALVAYAVKPGAMMFGDSMAEPAAAPILQVVLPDGSDRQALTPPEGTVQTISFSPDDAFITYDSVSAEHLERGSVWIQATDGSSLRKLTGRAQMPAWRPAASP